MKKSLVALALAFSAFAADAASYRGFFDLFGGVTTGGKTTVNAGDLSVSNIKNDFAFGFNMTHGCQITPFLYAGAGFGAFSTLMSGEEMQWGDSYSESTMIVPSIDIPIYIDVRYDLNIRKKVTPFVDLKLGYSINVNFDDNWGSYTSSSYHDVYTSSELSLKAKGESGFYFQPSIGFRFRMGKKSGFNLGIAYNTTLRRTLEGRYLVVQNDIYSSSFTDITMIDKTVELKKLKEGAFMLHLGFDF